MPGLRHAAVVGRELRRVGQASDFARGIDRGTTIDLGARGRAIGDTPANDEVERRPPPHTIRQFDLRKA